MEEGSRATGNDDDDDDDDDDDGGGFNESKLHSLP